MQEKKSIINFGAGPAALSAGVYEEAAKAIINYNNSGLSILEIPHRGPLFEEILAETKKLVLDIAQLSADEYEVIWMQGGGRMQFAMIPMNFLDENSTAGYIDSGHWAYEAIENAKHFGNVSVLASTKNTNYTSVPKLEEPIAASLSYVHLTTNNTIFGTQIKEIPECPVPLFADMSSDIFSEKRDYSKYDLFYAVAQKNLGAAGNTLVVLRKKLLNKIVHELPPILDYGQHVLHNSLLNTPPVFAIYVSLLTLRGIKEKGIETIRQETDIKSEMLYKEIERNELFNTIAAPESRSKMNVVFRGKTVEIEQEFLAYSLQHNIEGIAGHRSVGGFRVSLYNAITIEQVTTLVSLMQNFEKNKNL